MSDNAPIEKDDRVVIFSGTGVPGAAAMQAMINELVPKGMVIATKADHPVPNIGNHEEVLTRHAEKVLLFGDRYGTSGALRKPINPEHAAWNARVDAEKADKKAAKLARKWSKK